MSKRLILCAVIILVASSCTGGLAVSDTQGDAAIGTEKTLPQVTIIHAGFETQDSPDTRTSLEMNEDNTAAKVCWTRGDAIRVLARKSGNTFYTNDFTTDADGVTSADFECESWTPEGSVRSVYAFYPAQSFQGLRLDSGYGLGVVFPAVQTAVPGSVAEGLNISYAMVSSLADDFFFRNIPSLIKFRLSGSSVSEINTIKFSANTSIAGEGMLMNIASSSPYIDFSKYYGDLTEPASSTVSLNKPSGDLFREGVDYYIAVAPCVSEGFSMTFTDSNGTSVTKTSTKTLEMKRSVIADLGTISVEGMGDPLVRKYMTQRTGSRPVDLVVIPDGFTADQRSLFESLAASGIDFVFNTEPFKSYRDYFNVYFIWAPSNQQGGSVTDGSGNIIEYHDTAFGTRWGRDSYSDTSLDFDKTASFVQAHCPEMLKGQLSINDIPILVIVNDARYGGICLYGQTGWAFCVVPYTFSGGGIRWDFMNRMPNTNTPVESNWNYSWHTRTANDMPNEETYNIGDWRNTILHEYGGHGFGRLTDEYWYDENRWYTNQGGFEEHNWPVSFALNVSGYYNNIPWQTVLDRYNAGRLTNPKPVGRFQGGAGSIFNVWRSELSSCMINNNQYFSAWQRVLIAKRIVEKAGETFNLDSHLANEGANPVPYRNGDTKRSAAVKTMPHLPHPVLLDVFSQTSVQMD